MSSDESSQVYVWLTRLCLIFSVKVLNLITYYACVFRHRFVYICLWINTNDISALKRFISFQVTNLITKYVDIAVSIVNVVDVVVADLLALFCKHIRHAYIHACVSKYKYRKTCISLYVLMCVCIQTNTWLPTYITRKLVGSWHSW